MTSQPSAAKAVAMPRPIPLVEPVTIAVLPFSMYPSSRWAAMPRTNCTARQSPARGDAQKPHRLGEALDPRSLHHRPEPIESCGDLGLRRQRRRQYDIAALALAL